MEFFDKEDKTGDEQKDIDVGQKEKVQPEEPIMEQIRVLILYLKKYQVLDQLINNISEVSRYPVLDA